MKDILIIRLSAIGDVLLTTPVLQQLKQQFPQARIHFLVKEQYAEFIAACPHQDNIIIWKKEDTVFTVRRRLSAIAPRFDLVLDLQSNLKSRLLVLLLPAEAKRRYQKPYLNRLLLVCLKHNRYKEKKRISERYLDALQGIVPPPLTGRIELRRDKLPRDSAKFVQATTILIAPGARWATKRWPAEYFVSLASKLLEKHVGCQVVWLGGKDEEKTFTFIAEHPYLRRHHKRMLFLAGVLGVGQMVELADHCAAIVTNDSGLMHLLSASKTPMISLFLSTVEEFGFYPLSDHAQVLAARDIPCRPCNHKGLPECPKKHFRCGRELTADQVYLEIAKFIAPVRAPAPQDS
ncbi:MAG: glycosyltransferase family 9 protein [Turneriella sp.]